MRLTMCVLDAQDVLFSTRILRILRNCLLGHLLVNHPLLMAVTDVKAALYRVYQVAFGSGDKLLRHCDW